MSTAPDASITRSAPAAPEESLDGGDRVLLAGVDDVVGAELRADVEPALSGADQDDLIRPERLARLDGHQPDRAWPDHDDRLAGDVSADRVQAVHAGAGRHDQDGVLPGDVLRHLVEGADVVDDVLGEPAVDGHAGGAMAARQVAEVEAGGVHPEDAVLTATTPFVGVDGDPVADRELVDARAEGRDRTGPLVARGERAVRRAAWSGRAIHPADVRPAGAAHRDLDEHLALAGLGTGFSTTRMSP